jgi:1-phosphofructokinase family hexose kinase
MIYTLTLNPTIDHTLTINGFDIGGTFKAAQSTRLPAGKGINVAHVVATLGEPAVALGLVGQQETAAFAASLGDAGIENRLVPVPGGTRISVTLLDPQGGTETHVREPGAAPPPEGLARVEAQLARLSTIDWVVLAGSLPPGMAVEVYRDLIRVCAARGAKTCLDANGAPLLAGVDAPPALLKVNLFELWQVDRGAQPQGHTEQAWDVSMPEIVAAARRIQARGIDQVVVTLGERGAIGLGRSGKAWHARTALDRPVVDAVGSGDAMGAGLVVALERGWSLDRALRLGVACGAANALVAGAGRCRKEDIERLEERAVVQLLK